MDSDDANIKGAKNDVRIGCTFCDLPRELIIDADSSTTFFEEFLLNDDGDLQIVKHFDCKVKTTPKPKTFIIANHPSIDIVNICFNKKLLNLEKE
jgi:putative ATP-dependent endonuclease of OLD family